MSVRIRPIEPTDSVVGVTELLHDAYRQLGELGLNYTAVDQDAAATWRRIDRGECLLADVDGDVVGTVTWYAPGTLGDGCAWYRRPEVAAFGQFAVRPTAQRKGIGSSLIAEVERRARIIGARELALDTAMPAKHLIEYYVRRGFRRVDTAQWKGKTYRSVILSKALI